jgi:hypothetical protein
MKELLKALDGHKSAIGATVNLVIMWAVQYGYIPENIAPLVLGVASIWTGIAVGHNMSKVGK